MIKTVADINPADYNPRKITERELNKLENSLNEFGDLSGIVVNLRTNNLISGHQRTKKLNPDFKIYKEPYKDITGTVSNGYIETSNGRFSYREVDWEAAKEMAANIAANKIGGAWDNDKLKEVFLELDQLNFELELTGFDLPKIENMMLAAGHPEEKENFRETLDFFHLNKFMAYANNKYDIPLVKKQSLEISELIGFNYCLSAKKEDYSKTIHFYLDDYQFDRVWNNPYYYTPTLKMFNGAISATFSTYADMPLAIQIYNIYRNRYLGALWQREGLTVIPSIVWGNERTLEAALMGLDKNPIISIGTLGPMKEKELKAEFIKEYKYIIEKLDPELVILYGDHIPKECLKLSKTIQFKADYAKRRDRINGKESKV